MVRTAVDSMDALIYRIRTVSQDLIKLRGIEKKLPPKPKKTNLRYIFKELAVALDSTFEIKEDDVRLNDYSDARKIRHRITHPKKPKDLNISVKKEYVKFADTYVWFSGCFKQLIKNPYKPNPPPLQAIPSISYRALFEFFVVPSIMPFCLFFHCYTSLFILYVPL